MAYSTQTDIELAAGGATRLLELADWDGNGSVDATVIADVQLEADALIDERTRMRFAELKDSTGAVLPWAAKLAAQEAVYRLRLRRGQASDLDERMAVERAERYVAIAEGRARPGEPAPAKSTAVKSAFVERDSEGTSVSREGLKGYW